LKDDMNVVLHKLSEFADYSMWRRGTPGMVLGITDRGKTLFTAAKGFSDIASGRPLSTDSLFQIGSVSKSFTCIALLQLAEQGVLDIHKPVREYLPWLSIRSRYSEITLHHLMTHSAGIVIGLDATPVGWTEAMDLNDTEATCEPGTYFHYSNSGYKVLGLVLETVTGKAYGTIIREGILEGAGMRSSEPVITNDIRGRHAVAHQPMHDDRPFRRGSALYPAPWFESGTADGTICAPVEDMLAYIRVLMKGGEGPWGRIMSAESFRLMITPYITPDDELHSGGYGYGLNIESIDGHTYIGHQGGMVGYYTSMLMDTDSGIGAMVMVNGPGDPEEVARFAMEAIRRSSDGKPLPDVPSKEDAYKTPKATEYRGTFAGPHGRLDAFERNGMLRILTDGHEMALEPREHDSFLVDGPGFDLFLLEFEKVDGKIDRVHHGERTYVRNAPGCPGEASPDEQLVRYEGHFRSHNPWLTNFRVVRRRDGLRYVHRHGASEQLVPVGENSFRIGSDERSPERITFDGIINGVATSATVAGGGRFGRTFTP